MDTVLTSTTSNLNQLILSVLKVGGKFLDLSSDFSNNSLGKFSVIVIVSTVFSTPYLFT